MGIILFACTPETERPVLPEALAPKAPALAKEGDSEQSIGLRKAEEEEWERTVNAAKKEGRLAVYSGSNPEVRAAQAKAFHERFGITIEHTPGSASQLATKIISEYKANIFYADIYSGGISTTLTMLKPAEVIVPLDPVLTLPEVLDSRVWYGGKLPFVDQAHTTMIITLGPGRRFIINTDLVKTGEMNSYQDLLNPKWKGKIILNNPTSPPGGDQWFTAYVYRGILSTDYMKALARQEPFISRDRRMAAEWLSRGKYAISIGTGWDNFEEFAKLGAPIRDVDPAEGDYLGVGAGAIAIMKNPPHPNAAKVFINWVLSKEGATVTSRAYTKQSTRLDVPTDFLTTSDLRQTGKKYFDGDSEEIYLKMPEYRKMAVEIFGHLLR